MADKTNGDKNINGTFWATWSKFRKTDNPEEAKIALLEVSSLRIPSKLLQQLGNYNYDAIRVVLVSLLLTVGNFTTCF